MNTVHRRKKTPKIPLLLLGSWMFMADVRSDFLSIPDPGVKTAPDPGSGSLSATLKK
jgi:hypothetical protein